MSKLTETLSGIEGARKLTRKSRKMEIIGLTFISATLAVGLLPEGIPPWCMIIEVATAVLGISSLILANKYLHKAEAKVKDL